MPFSVKRNKRLLVALLLKDDALMQEDPIDEQASVHGVRRGGLLKPILSDLLP